MTAKGRLNACRAAAGLVLTLAGLGNAYADPLTFEQALGVLIDNPATQSRQAAQAAAGADRDTAQWQRYPTPTLEATAEDAGKQTVTLRLDQPLWTGGRITAGIDAAGRRLDAAGVAVEEVRLDLALRLIAAFTEVLHQQAKRDDATAAIADYQSLVNTVRRRVQQDLTAATELNLAEARLIQANMDLSTINQALANATAQLRTLYGEQITEVSDVGIRNVRLPATLNLILAQAETYSPALRRMAFEEAAAEADITSIRANAAPQVGLRLEKSAGTVRDNRLMIVVQVAPGAGLSNKSAVSAATSRRESLRQAREATLRDVRERVILDWNELTAAQSRLADATDARDSYVEVLESYRRQYLVGRKASNDVLNASREATQAEFAVEDAQSQVIAATLRLSAQIGMLNQAGATAPRPIVAEPELVPAAPPPLTADLHVDAAPAVPTMATAPSSPSIDASAAGAYRVQLGAYADPKAALAGWEKTRKMGAELLGDFQPMVVAAEVKGRTLQRLQTGPLPNSAAATQLCQALKAKGADCLVVRP